MNSDVAVTGMACRLPGSNSLGEFWNMLSEGRSGIRRLPEAEILSLGIPESETRREEYVPVYAGIEDADKFDSAFFAISKLEADVLDPQFRVLLETSQHALEDAALDSKRFGDIGTFASVGFNNYLLRNLLPNERVLSSVGQFVLATSNDKDNVAARIAYKLDLRGPSMTLQSNCSSGLVGIHQAVAALLDYQCDAALVAAAAIKSRHPRGYVFEAGGMYSRTGTCRAFDADADGYLIGDGVVAVVLRRAEDVADDRVYAIVKGSAVNNDGGEKVSYAATSRSGQVRVMKKALLAANTEAKSVDYVEANGSGTVMGDAIELAALDEVYGKDVRVLPIGSLKPSVGNLDTASGLASFVKAVLVLHHSTIPGTLNYTHPNRHSEALDRTLKVVDRTRPLRGMQNSDVARVAVSSFGVGGTNAHLILEGCGVRTSAFEDDLRDVPRLFAVSGRTSDDTIRYANRVADDLKDASAEQMRDVSHSLLVGAPAHGHRAAVVAATASDAVRRLRSCTPVKNDILRPTWAVVIHDNVPNTGLESMYPSWPLLRKRLERLGDRGAEALPIAILKSLESLGLVPDCAWGGSVAAEVATRQGIRLLSSADELRDASYAALLSIGIPDAPVLLDSLDGQFFSLLDGLSPNQETPPLLGVVGFLWSAGVEIDGAIIAPGRRTSLPKYPFLRTMHWIQDSAANDDARENRRFRPSNTRNLKDETLLETAVRSIWTHRLGEEDFGLDDSLMELGGDSLRATQLLGDVADVFQIDLSLREFLGDPTIRAMSSAIHAGLIESRELREALDELRIDEGSSDDHFS